MKEIFGLPAHPLMVHAPVVLTPLVSFAAVLVAVRPAWRVRYGWHLLVASAVLLVSTFLATQSGEGLDELMQGTASIERHEDLAETARLLIIGLFVAVLAVVLIGRWLDGRIRATTGRSVGAASAGTGAPAWATPVKIGLAAAMVVLAVLSTVWIIRTGHEGARVVWETNKS